MKQLALRKHESLVITEPRGKLSGKVADYLKSKGYVVKQLDLDKSDEFSEISPSKRRKEK